MTTTGPHAPEQSGTRGPLLSGSCCQTVFHAGGRAVRAAAGSG
jgi:hypothetical protein